VVDVPPPIGNVVGMVAPPFGVGNDDVVWRMEMV
jgi:hypothetical protein